jgi:SAM-dependent methyltransferase
MPERARARDVEAGQAVYSPLLLRFYDAFVLGFSNRLLWRCPSSRLLAHYDRHVGPRHLDVGVGTGYFLDRCRFPTAAPSIVLADMNANSLAAAAKRIARYAPRVVRANVLEPLALGAERFDSIGLNYLLHCLPGTLESKAAALDNLRPLLAPGGVLFGSTILGQDARMNPPARALNAIYNRKGIFTNHRDSADGLGRALAARFPSHRLEVLGCVALFSARLPP